MTKTLAEEEKQKVMMFARLLGADVSDDSEEEEITEEDYKNFETPKPVEKITGDFFGSKKRRKK